MRITVAKTGLVPVNKFKNLIDISKVTYYSLKEKDGNITLKFYDKNHKLIKPYKDIKNGKSCKKDK